MMPSKSFASAPPVTSTARAPSICSAAKTTGYHTRLFAENSTVDEEPIPHLSLSTYAKASVR